MDDRQIRAALERHWSNLNDVEKFREIYVDQYIPSIIGRRQLALP